MNPFQGLPKDVMRLILKDRRTVLTLRRVSWWFYNFITFECNRYWFKEYFTWKCNRDREFAWKHGFLEHKYMKEWEFCFDPTIHVCDKWTCFRVELPVLCCGIPKKFLYELESEAMDMANALGIPSKSPAELGFVKLYITVRTMPDDTVLRNCLFRNLSHWTRVTNRSIWPFYDESVNYLRKIQITGVQLFIGCNTLALREELSKMEIIEIERQKQEMIDKYERIKVERQARVAYQKAYAFCEELGIDDEEMRNN